MSASREKKQRQSDLSQGLTQKQRQELQEQQAAKRKAVLYTVIGVIIAVLVVILLVWHSGIFQRRATAVSVGGRNYNVNDVGYYFYSAMQTEYSYASMFGISSFDPSQDLRTQYVDEEQTQSYYDYFMEQAMTQLTKVAALENAAAEEGFTLSDEEKAAVDEQIESTKTSVEQSGYYPNLESYLKYNFGKYMTVSAFRTCLEREALVSSYQTAYSDKQEVTDADLDTYYQENAGSLDSFDYRYILVDGSAPSTTDEEGNTVEATEEEQQAAMDAAKEKADEFAAAVEAAEDKSATFGELAPDYVSESSKENYENDPDYSLHTGTVGSSLSSTYGSWLQEEGRTAGDVTVIEGSTGYYVVLFLDRYRNEEPTADIREIFIKAELTQEDDAATEDVDESTVPTQEALDAAKTEAESLLAQWEGGDKTADSFAALAEANSDDSTASNGGLTEAVTKGSQSEELDAWLFDESRQSGDTLVIEDTTSGSQGWRVVYFQGWNDPVWKNSSDSAIRSQRLNDWIDGLMEGLEATQGNGVKYVYAD